MPTGTEQNSSIVNNNQYVVVIGNPIDGITIWGPFETQEDAEQYTADEDCHDWYITELNTP